MKHTVALLVALLLAPLAAVHAADDGAKPEALRRLARLPSVDINYKQGFQSTDFELDKTNTAPRKSEAELREILKASPTNATAWCDLGEQLLARATREHLRMERLGGEGTRKLLAAVQAGQLSKDDVHCARQLMEEALACFSKAIACAPEKLDGYLKRLGCQLFFRTGLVALANAVDGQKTNPAQYLTPETLADFQQVTRLRPDNVNSQTTFLFYLFVSNEAAKSKYPGAHGEAGFVANMRAATVETRARLETLATRNDPKLAAQAYEGLAMNALVCGAINDAQKYCRRFRVGTAHRGADQGRTRRRTARRLRRTRQGCGYQPQPLLPRQGPRTA